MKIIKTSDQDIFAFWDGIRSKTRINTENVETIVGAIIGNVRINKDAALLEYSLKFDGASKIAEYKLVDFKAAFDNLDESFRKVLIKSAERIRAFHLEQVSKGIKLILDGSEIGQLVRSLNRVGLYVPGGTAAYPSSVLMNAIPAKIAGVKEIVIVTPPSKNGVNKDVLAAAYISGVDTLYAVGGAQAIAALAYGTETIKKVDKIVGPGNIYVATAKRMVFGVCDIDMIAGPSEITIIADEKANERYIAADLMSQAEHDPLASAILITPSESLALKVNKEVERQLEKLQRSNIIRESLYRFGAIIVCGNLSEAVEIANHIAPEHLEIMTKEPFVLLDQIKNAGSVFLGEYTPEPIGDYIAGTNHVLPTGGSARFFSPLSVDSFIKKIQYVSYCKKKFTEDAENVILFAEREGLTAHANSIKVRME